MSVRLTIETRSAQGQALALKLNTFQELMDGHCSCPDGTGCDVEVEEGASDWWDVIVTRPGFAPAPGETWSLIRGSNETCYVGSFLNPSAAMLASAIVHLVSIPLTHLF